MAGVVSTQSTKFVHSLPPYPHPKDSTKGRWSTSFVRAVVWLTAGRKQTPEVIHADLLAQQWFARVPQGTPSNLAERAVSQFGANMYFFRDKGVDPYEAFLTWIKNFVIEEEAARIKVAPSRIQQEMESSKTYRREFQGVVDRATQALIANTCPPIVKKLKEVPQKEWIRMLKDLGVEAFGQEAEKSGSWQDRIAPLVFAASGVFLLEVIDTFKLKPIDWKPSDGFSRLSEELNKKGPMIVVGAFGPAHHTTPPTQFEKPVMGHQVWGWLKQGQSADSKKDSKEVIIVIGVDQKERILYLDPVDDRIYIISREGFLAKIASATILSHEEPYTRLNVFGYQDLMWSPTFPPVE